MEKNKVIMAAVFMFFIPCLAQKETPDHKRLRKHIYRDKVALTTENKDIVTKVIRDHAEQCKKKLNYSGSFLTAIPFYGCVAFCVVATGFGVVNVVLTNGSEGKGATIVGLSGLAGAYKDKIESKAREKKLTGKLERDNKMLEKLNSIQK